jgi:hypothetical protein
MSGKKPFRFAMPEPKQGITAFDVTVEAEDKQSAVNKLVDYLIELRRSFLRQPAPLAKTNDPARIGNQMLFRLGQSTDPTAFVLTIHLFCEYWLNLILTKFCPHRDLTKHSFFTKLEIAFATGKIPKPLFENLQKLNALRNQISHELDFDFTTMNLDYHPTHPLFKAKEYRPSYAADAKQHHIFNVLSVVMADTYWNLHNHCVRELGFKKITAAVSA